jgi:hypothetical protein
MTCALLHGLHPQDASDLPTIPKSQSENLVTAGETRAVQAELWRNRR